MAETKVTTEKGDEYVSLNGFKSFGNEDIGKSFFGSYCGVIDRFQMNNGNEITQHLFLSDEGFMKLNETYNLKVLNAVPPGTPLELVYLGTEKVANGEVKRFDIKVKRTHMDDTVKAIASSMQSGQLAIKAGDDTTDPFADN